MSVKPRGDAELASYTPLRSLRRVLDLYVAARQLRSDSVRSREIALRTRRPSRLESLLHPRLQRRVRLPCLGHDVEYAVHPVEDFARLLDRGRVTPAAI